MKEQVGNIKSEYRDNLTVLKEQERQSKLTNTLARENIDTLRQTARENVKAITNGDLKLADVFKEAETDEQKLVAHLTQQGLTEAKAKEEKSGPSVLGGLLAYENINKLLSTASAFTSTQNGFDLIKPAASSAGQIIGGILGGIVGTLIEPGGGTAAGAVAGSSIGKAFGDAAGEFDQRKAFAKEDFYKVRNRYNAIAGSEPSLVDTEREGLGVTDFVRQQAEYARKRGYSAVSSNTTREALYLEKGVGVDPSTTAGLIEVQRSAKESNRDLAQLIGGVLEKGRGNIFKNGDTTFLNEFLTRFTSLQKELLKTSETVPTGTTMDILSKFNEVGGAFAARDSRSAGNISSINETLSNPQSDNVKALSYRVLSEQHPNAGLFDLREMMQGGLKTPGYLEGMISYVDRIGGDDQMKMNNLSGMFPGVPLSGIRRLYQNREMLEKKSTSVEELSAKFPNDFKSKADANTTTIERNSASVQNSLLQNNDQTVSKMVDAFSSAVRETMSGAVIELNNGKMTLKPKGAPIMRNTTKKAIRNSDAGIGGTSGDPYRDGDYRDGNLHVMNPQSKETMDRLSNIANGGH